MDKNKTIAVFFICLSVLVICLALCQLLGIWENAIYVYEPLIGVVLLLQACMSWKKNRKVAVIQLASSVFVLCCMAIILLFR